MNVIQGTKPDGQQYHGLLDTVVIILKYNKSTIDLTIYIKLFSDETVSYIRFSNDEALNITNKETSFPKLRRV